MISGVSLCQKAQMANRAALTANQQLKNRSNLRRSIRSAKAPAGSVNRKNGKVPADDITESRNADAPSEFMAQVAAMSWAVTQQPETTSASQNRR